jgi:hypothetical protein
MGAGGAAALATVVASKEAQAGHDATNTFHLGAGNSAPAGTQTTMTGDVGHFAFGIDNANTAGGGGIHSRSRGGLAAVHGSALDTGSPGLFGTNDETLGSGPGTGPGPGVVGLSGSGAGVEGQSQTGAGVHGHSDSGLGGSFSTLAPGGKASTSTAQTGGTGVEGAAFPTEEETEFEDLKAGYGVRGVAMSAEGGYGEGPGVGVHGQSGTGTGVFAIATGAGTALTAHALAAGGIGLEVIGPSRFSTAGSATIPAGQESAFVASSGVTGESHISVTLASDPGPRTVRWVERSPGSGFVVHLSSAPPSKRPETHLTYLIVEPV